MAGKDWNLSMKRRSIQSFQRQTKAPPRLQLKAPPRGHGAAVASTDQRQPLVLRPIADQRRALHRPAQVGRQWFGLPYRKHAGLFQRAAHQRGDVARCKDRRIAQTLQVVVDLDEPRAVKRQPGFAQPRCAAGLRDPNDFIHLQHGSVTCLQAPGGNLGHFTIDVKHHLTFSQHALEGMAHAAVVRRQNF